MNTATSKLNSSLATLQDSVNKFTIANKGNAPDAYAGAQNTWNQGHEAIKKYLIVGQQRLQAIIAEYVGGDNRGAGYFS
jgi:uncharacterized protein YukE